MPLTLVADHEMHAVIARLHVRRSLLHNFDLHMNLLMIGWFTVAVVVESSLPDVLNRHIDEPGRHGPRLHSHRLLLGHLGSHTGSSCCAPAASCASAMSADSILAL